MKNTKKHLINDVVYIQQYCWPPGIVKYIVTSIRTETGHPDVYILQCPKHPELFRSSWGYAVFDNTDAAFAYQYDETCQTEHVNLTVPKPLNRGFFIPKP